MKILIGVDPGERWAGIAVMAISGDEAQLMMGVLDNHHDYLRAARILNSVFEQQSRCILTVEDYRVRPAGHQKFTRGLTLRAIGALEYVAASHSVRSFSVPPGNIKSELRSFRIAGVLTKWSRQWPSPGSANWEHARSAWRLIGQTLLREYTSDLEFFAPGHQLIWPVSALGRQLSKPWESQLSDRDLWTTPIRVRVIE